MQQKINRKINLLVTTVLVLIIAAILQSCSATKGNMYQIHLMQKHTGGHSLSNENKGCGWNK
jgi:hypothetical protein